MNKSLPSSMFAFLVAVLCCIAAGKSLAEENRQLRRINNALLKSVTALSEEQVGASFDSGAVFYEGINYNGERFRYEENGSVITLPWSLADKFQSVQIGKLSKVFAWTQYNSAPSTAYELSQDTSDLGFVGGISKFKVTPKEVKGVYVRLVDDVNTGTLYCMTPKVYGPPGEGADVNSCTDNESFQLLGTLNSVNGDEEIVTQIPVRNMDHNSPNFSEYISNGSLFFKVDSSGEIVVSHDNGQFEDFPENLTIRKVRANRFEIAIRSEEPDLNL